jgi:hypothetical protein
MSFSCDLLNSFGSTARIPRFLQDVVAHNHQASMSNVNAIMLKKISKKSFFKDFFTEYNNTVCEKNNHVAKNGRLE